MDLAQVGLHVSVSTVCIDNNKGFAHCQLVFFQLPNDTQKHIQDSEFWSPGGRRIREPKVATGHKGKREGRVIKYLID